MNIGLFSYSAYPENEFNPGIENLTYNLARKLSDENTVYIFESAGHDRNNTLANVETYRIHPVTSFGGFSINQFSFARRVVANYKQLINSLDVVHDVGSYIPFFTREIDVPVVTTFHHYQSPSTFKKYIEMIPEPLFIHKETYADKVVAVSSFAAEQVNDFEGVDEATIIPNGVDLSYYSPSTNTDESPNDCLSLLYVGGLNKRKNVSTLIRAMPKIIPNVGRQVHLTITGKGLLEHRLKSLVDELGIEQNVTFTGHIPEEQLRDQYRQADFFVFPSLLEGFGMVTIEAMACGTPVLTSDIRPLTEIVADSGLFFDPKDSDAIAATVLAATERDYPTLSKSARARAEKYGWDKVSEKYVKVYENLIEEY